MDVCAVGSAGLCKLLPECEDMVRSHEMGTVVRRLIALQAPKAA